MTRETKRTLRRNALGKHGGIFTLETRNGGEHVVCPGDWIITGVKGEHYSCKPDIFAMTYEPAQESRGEDKP